MAVEVFCFQCSQVQRVGDRVGFREECGQCRADLHVCRNCQHYDPQAYNECRETQAERVLEKDRSNRCDFFAPSNSPRGGKSSSEKLRAAAEALFKKKD